MQLARPGLMEAHGTCISNELRPAPYVNVNNYFFQQAGLEKQAELLFTSLQSSVSFNQDDHGENQRLRRRSSAFPRSVVFCMQG